MTIIIFMPLLILIAELVLFALVIRKAGYSGWWVLLGLVPGIGVVMLWIFAFSRWPVDDLHAATIREFE